MTKRGLSTEVDAYVFIKNALKERGWDVRNPERSPMGQVYTQNEIQSNPAIKQQLGLEKPENIVKINDRILWVIESKSTRGQISKALAEAEYYANKINQGQTYEAKFISGVAGNNNDGFIIRNRFFVNGSYEPIIFNHAETSGLLTPTECQAILHINSPEVNDPPIDDKLFLSSANRINVILYNGAVNPHQRASVMAALLLSMLSDTGPNIEESSPSILIRDINGRVKDVLQRHNKAEFYEYIRISLPSTTDNHIKFRKALVDTIQELNNLNIRSAMNSGADWLGAFYEVFLKYANWAQDLGIVLTPRHVTRFIADVMDIKSNDLVLDITSGTGGFLVAAFDSVKRRFNERQVQRFKENCLFGIEQDAGVASLAIVNMIFRGDGKNNIVEGNCFSKFLEASTHDGIVTAKYSPIQSANPPITKVMMNPPFALKKSDEKEFKFVNQALNQMEDGGILFSVLPYSAMVKPGAYKDWRKNQLMTNHTLLAVLTFPIDLFYPVGVTTVGVFIKKGTPHPREQKVLWLRALNDGLLKSKGKRLPHPRAKNDLDAIRNNLKAFLQNPGHPIPNIHQFSKSAPVDWSDPHLELVPEAYLDQAETTLQEVEMGLKQDVCDTLAFLIKLDRIDIKPDLLATSITSLPTKLNWKRFKITELFDLGRGNFHSIADLDPGEYLTISRISTDNGLVGFFDKPTKAKIWEPKTLTVSTVTGDAFVQPLPFIATDNVVLLNEKNGPLKITSLYFIQFMINQVRWRYSYGRQCYKTKFAETEIILPIKENGKLDEDSMEAFVRNVRYWRLVESIFE